MKTTIKKLSYTLNIPEDVIISVYKSYWKFIKTKLEELPLKEELSKEDFNKLRTSVNVPCLGKFYCDYSNYIKMKNKYKKDLENAKYKKDKTNGQLFGRN